MEIWIIIAIIAIGIAAGLFKSIAVMLITPVVAKKIGLTTPKAALIYGGLMGTTSGTAAGLAAPVTAQEFGISREEVYTAFLMTKDIRDKYIGSRLLWDLGELDNAAQML